MTLSVYEPRTVPWMMVAQMLRERKQLKRRIRHVADKFNSKPLKPDWIECAVRLGLMPTIGQSGSQSSASASEPGTDVGHAFSTIDAAAASSDTTQEKPQTQTQTQTQETANPPDVLWLAGEGGEGGGASSGRVGVTAAAVARFLRETPGLGPTEVGEYIGKGPADRYPFHANVLAEYVRTFDFSGKIVHACCNPSSYHFAEVALCFPV